MSPLASRLSVTVLAAIGLAVGCGHGPLLRIDPPVESEALEAPPAAKPSQVVAAPTPGLLPAVPDQTPRPAADAPAAQALLADNVRDSEPIARGTRRSAEQRVEPGVMPLHAPRHAYVASSVRGSASIGTVTGGRIAQSAELPPLGDHHQILAKVAPRNTRFTTDELRDLLLCAAQKVQADHPGQKLQLGNLSRMGGGPLLWSVSHQNGRDADLAFYTRSPDGQIAFADHLYHFGANLQSTDSPQPLVFDVAANWSLVKGLLTCDGPPIQHLFIANWLKRPLLDYAQKRKEDKELIARAAAILHQPRNAQPHHDHLHLRIACSGDDRAEGCLQAARAPAEAIGQSEGVRARLPAVRALLNATTADKRMDAVSLLVLYRDAVSLPQLRSLLRDSQPAVRAHTARELLAWAPEGLAQDLDLALAVETDPSAAAWQLAGLLQLGAAERLVARLHDPRTLTPGQGQWAAPTVAIRGLAASLLAETGSLDVAQTVVPLLADADPLVRHHARQTVQRIVNLSTEDLAAERLPQLALGGLPAGAALAPDVERDLWRGFFAALPAGTDRDALALRHLDQKVAATVGPLDRSALPGLVHALALPAPYRDNAARWIAKVVRYFPAAGRGARSQPLAFWGQWLVSRRLVPQQVVASAWRSFEPAADQRGRSDGAGSGAGSASGAPADDND